LLAHLGRDAVGIDMSREELAAAHRRDPALQLAQARAQALPFGDASFEHVVCHLAFMLFDEIEAVVAELARVIAPGGTFAAVLGGGPVADPQPDDAFARFLAIAKGRLSPRAFGDRRASSEDGWRALFTSRAGWSEPRFERHELDLGGTFDEVWSFLGASYQLAETDARSIRDELRAALGDRPASCRVATWVATVTLLRVE
jgi:ubiquinone/menaquinone biosynthesis C-methylase UbiE